MTQQAPKIFGIGLSKTGTTSLARALEMLGYRVKDYPGIDRYRPGDVTSVDLDVVDAHDALTDTPIPSFYRELDQKYPGSKFILTVRERAGWLKSCKKQFTEPHAARQNDAHKQLFMDLYGTVVFDEEKFRAGYDRFVAGVMDYFKDRPQDLLVIDVTAGEGWEKLCPFLGKAVPDQPFPKANVTQITWLKVEDIIAIAEAAGQKLLRARRQMTSSNPVTRLWLAMRGGKAAALRRATASARRVIEDGLKKLNGAIPVLARGSDVPPYAERAKWNHLWLADPLDGEEAFLDGSGDFTIDIALIQDGQPFLGVVHAPLGATTWYARTRKGAYVKTAGGAALAFFPTSGDSVVTHRGGSHAMRICLAAPNLEFEDRVAVHESRIAAAALIVTAANGEITTCTGGPLRFNSPSLESECVRVKTGDTTVTRPAHQEEAVHA
jgi:fructose-1,6-bisphosphatase/inositol monophosphatase family enzyme